MIRAVSLSVKHEHALARLKMAVFLFGSFSFLFFVCQACTAVGVAVAAGYPPLGNLASTSSVRAAELLFLSLVDSTLLYCR